MKSIIKTVLILCVIPFCLSLAQSTKLYFKADQPAFIKQDSTFQLSLVSSVSFDHFSTVNLFVLLEDNTELRKVVLRTPYESRIFKFSRAKFKNYLGKSYKISFDDCDSDSLFSSVNQILLTLVTTRSETSEIGFGIEALKNGKLVSTGSSFENTFNENYLPIVNLSFYESGERAGNSLLLKSQGLFDFEFPVVAPNDLMIEFWAKINSGNKNFFKLINPSSGNTIFSLKINRHQMIELPEYVFDALPRNYFVSAGNWNHYIIHFSKDDASASLYINDSMIYRTSLMNHFDNTNLKMEFRNENEKTVELDLLRIWDYKNSISTAVRNMNYLNYSADSSRLLASFSFDDEAEMERIKNTPGVRLNTANIKHTKSSAPIFSRRPELTVRNFESYYELLWSNREDAKVEEYIIEKSTDGRRYVALFTKSSVNENNKVYTYIDQKAQLEDVVYYRIKQINKDRSFLYSPQVKVGVGKIDLFNVNQNYPNPFNPETSISVDIYESGEYKITVYDIVGKEVQKIYAGSLAEGNYVYQFNGSNLPTGIYFFEVASPNSVQVIKMILAK